MSRSAVLVLLLVGCDVPEVMFVCSDNESCGASGICVSATGACAFPAPDCTSGYRYDHSAGALGGSCVSSDDGGVPSDGPVADMNAGDMAHPLAWSGFAVIPGDDVRGVWASDPMHAWAVGSHGKVWASTNQGASWAQGFADAGGNGGGVALNSIWGSGSMNIFVAGDDGYIYRSNNYGGSWTVSRKPDVGASLPNLKVIWGVSGVSVYAGVDTHPILHYVGPGDSSWVEEASPTIGGCVPDACMSIWGSGPNDIYAVGDGAQHWDGSSWQALVLPTTEVDSAVWGSGKYDVYIATIETVVYHSTDAGKSWDTIQFPGSHLQSMTGTSANDVYLGTVGGQVFHSVDRGQSWTSTPTGAPYINAMWAIDAANVIAAGGNQILWLK